MISEKKFSAETDYPPVNRLFVFPDAAISGQPDSLPDLS